MLHSQDLVDHLKQQGFDIQTALIADSLSGELRDLSKNTENSILVNLPFTKGINVSLPSCTVCEKKFASNEAVNKHLQNAHFIFETDAYLDESSNFKQNEEQDISGENQVPTQYEIFDKDFLISKSNADEEKGFIVVFKVDNCFDILSSKGSANGRRVRKAETKPRKIYGRGANNTSNTEYNDNVFTGPLNCVQCGATFDSCCEYSKHYHEEHSKRKSTAYKCQICEKKFVTNEHIYRPVDQSVKMTVGEDVAHCNECQITFESFAEFVKHKQEEHRATAFKCEFEDCAKVFPTYGALNQHSKIHSGVRPFVCLVPSCMKSFSQKSGLDQHVRIHTSQRPYSCVICSMSFRQSAHLSQHMRTHSRIQPYRCPHCPKRFKQSSHLSNHIQVIHTNI